MVNLKDFSVIRNAFSRLNPLNSFDFDEINEEIEKPPTSDELLKKTIINYPYFEKVILVSIYHLINTQNVKNEYLSVFTKDLRLICDLVEGNGDTVDIPKILKNEPDENILLTCHNHFQKAIIPSTKDFKNVVKPQIKFTIIVSENHIGIVVNELGDKFLKFRDDEKISFKNTWKRYMDYIIFCLGNDKPDDVLNYYSKDFSNMEDKEEFQQIFEEYVGENIPKFADEFNVRFKKYNVYCIHIKLYELIIMSNALETFDGGLGMSNLGILLKIYGKEKYSKESRKNYEEFLKNNYPDEYEDFLDYKLKVKKKTPNIKDLIFDWMDGKSEIPDFELFDVYDE